MCILPGAMIAGPRWLPIVSSCPRLRFLTGLVPGRPSRFARDERRGPIGRQVGQFAVIQRGDQIERLAFDYQQRDAFLAVQLQGFGGLLRQPAFVVRERDTERAIIFPSVIFVPLSSRSGLTALS